MMLKKSKVRLFATLLFPFMLMPVMTHANESASVNIRVATFNVSMEALNYVENGAKVTGQELADALQNQHPQIKNIAEIIQQIAPDIILLNEFDYIDDVEIGIKSFIKNYLNKSQNGQAPIDYPYFYLAESNTGQPLSITGTPIQSDPKSHGFGYFPGHFAMVLLSKYPIDISKVRTFQKFLWPNMPGALKPINPSSNTPYYRQEVWQTLRLSSKSHWDIPVTIAGEKLHILASHPTPPVFDGEEDRNGRRNHDEIRLWLDYIEENNSDYLSDDNGKMGGLGTDKRFVILGDLNASPDEGDAINTAIKALVTHDKIQDPSPTSSGGQEHSPENKFAALHTAQWRMRADYVLPSKMGIKILDSGVFWPQSTDKNYRLIATRQASSDHRLVWVDMKLVNDLKDNK